mgnify:FL=1
MKKVLLMLLFMPFIVFAKDYKIDEYKILITPLSNGDVNVKEVFSMNDLYNGYEKVIQYKNNYEGYIGSITSATEDMHIYDADNVILNEIRGVNYKTDEIFSNYVLNGDLFFKSQQSKKGDYGTYKEESMPNLKKYKIYNSSKMNKDFYIDYTIKNLSITHKDVSEIVYAFNSTESIKNMIIYINIPNNLNYFDVYVHNVSFKSEKIDNSNVVLYINDISEDFKFDIRIICDKNNSYNKKTNEVIYEKIDKIEKLLDSEIKNRKDIEYNEYNNLKSLAYDSVSETSNKLDRESYEYAVKTVALLKDNDELKTELLVKLMNLESKIYRKEIITKIINSSILVLWFFGLVIMLYFIYKKYDKWYKIIFKKEYMSDINYMEPIKVGYLMKKRISNNDIVSSLLNLIYTNKIEFKKINENNFSLKLVSDELDEQQKKLIKLIFDKKDSITYCKVISRVSKNHNYFINEYSNYITSSTFDNEEEDYYVDMIIPKIIGISYSIIGVIASILLIGKSIYFSPFITIFISFLSLIYFIFVNKKTMRGNEYYSRWIAFKNYLNKVSINELKNKNDDTLNMYITYSLVLNNYDKLHKKLNKIGKDTYISDTMIIFINTLLNVAYNHKNIELYES